MFDIDVNGALAVKKHYPQAMLFFIKPPSVQALKDRLVGRKSETDSSMEKRLERLEYEYEQAKLFDYIIINDELGKAVSEIESIIIKSEI